MITFLSGVVVGALGYWAWQKWGSYTPASAQEELEEEEVAVATPVTVTPKRGRPKKTA